MRTSVMDAQLHASAATPHGHALAAMSDKLSGARFRFAAADSHLPVTIVPVLLWFGAMGGCYFIVYDCVCFACAFIVMPRAEAFILHVVAPIEIHFKRLIQNTNPFSI